MTNHPSRFPRRSPSQTFRLNTLPHYPARVHSDVFHKTPLFRPELTLNHRPSKILSRCPSCKLFTNSYTAYPLPYINLPPIILSHHYSLHLPHPYSISHMGYTKLPWRPHGSHCTHIQGWYAGVKKILSPCKLTYPLLIFHFRQHPVLVR